MIDLPTIPTIFVQIASYRDKELLPTISDILAKAKYPDKLSFGVCWQHDSNESLGEYLYNKQFRIISVDWRASKGCCWARSKTQMLYEGENLTLQIDSHMRFIQDWDVELVEMFRQCNHHKPILTYYPPQYTFKDGKEILSEHTTPQALTIDKFESGFIPYFGSVPLQVAPPVKVPVMGRFLAAGFLCTLGKFCIEVPYNPNIYFLGEEIDLAVRSFTKGYNIFHPHKSVCWHYFIRKGEPRHWEDHTKENVTKGEVADNYVDMTYKGFDILKKVLWEDKPKLGIYGHGDMRTLRDFELFAGVNLKRKIVHPDAKRKLPPVTTDNDWEIKTTPKVLFDRTLILDLSKVPVLDDYEFWYFGLHNAENVEIYRKDFREPEYLIDRRNDVHVYAVLDHKPKTMVLWPVSKSKGWQQKIVQKI